MSLDFRTHRLWDSYTTVHLRVALIIGALLIAPILTGARPWDTAACEVDTPKPSVSRPLVNDPSTRLPTAPGTRQPSSE